MSQFSGKQILTFAAQIFPKMDFVIRISKISSLDLESAPPKYRVCQTLVKIDNPEFFGLNLGKMPNKVRYFGSNNVEGAAETWVEVDATGCRWVHGLVIPTVIPMFYFWLR